MPWSGANLSARFADREEEDDGRGGDDERKADAGDSATRRAAKNNDSSGRLVRQLLLPLRPVGRLDNMFPRV